MLELLTVLSLSQRAVKDRDLQKNKLYYMEVLHTDEGSTDHVIVQFDYEGKGWHLIPQNYLLRYYEGKG